uniref:Uncharacterized protein n=1 Tax=Romanomermis culicivorax TaxID=13658 RepID=A0A915IXS6_ROMCU
MYLEKVYRLVSSIADLVAVLFGQLMAFVFDGFQLRIDFLQFGPSSSSATGFCSLINCCRKNSFWTCNLFNASRVDSIFACLTAISRSMSTLRT